MSNCPSSEYKDDRHAWERILPPVLLGQEYVNADQRISRCVGCKAIQIVLKGDKKHNVYVIPLEVLNRYSV